MVGETQRRFLKVVRVLGVTFLESREAEQLLLSLPLVFGESFGQLPVSVPVDTIVY